MGRHIPIALQAHKNESGNTTCLLMKISPVTPGFSAYGVTTLDRDVVYDDGYGEMTYSAAVGFEPTSLQFRGDMSVDNAEATSLMPVFDIPVSEADIRAGAYDFAACKVMEVNFEDLTMGHVTLQEGTVGQITIDANGLSFVNEIRGLVAQLKQSVCEKDSLTCRAPFGSQPIGSLIPGPQLRRGWCGFDAEALLVDAEVVSLGLENTVTFTVTPATGLTTNSLAPGLVVWVSGLNAGRSNEIDSNTAGGQITLRFPTDFPVQVGDQLRYRPDCNHNARDSSRGCAHWFGAEWVLHFRGEPDIPIGDAAQLETPHASSGPGMGAPVFEPAPEGMGP
jgi:uncharacterized phage protein (TIGR02218 family)